MEVYECGDKSREKVLKVSLEMNKKNHFNGLTIPHDCLLCYLQMF